MLDIAVDKFFKFMEKIGAIKTDLVRCHSEHYRSLAFENEHDFVCLSLSKWNETEYVATLTLLSGEYIGATVLDEVELDEALFGKFYKFYLEH